MILSNNQVLFYFLRYSCQNTNICRLGLQEAARFISDTTWSSCVLISNALVGDPVVLTHR